MPVEIIRVPDLGGAEEVEVIEIPIAIGDQVEIDDTLVVLESEKATMELPAPCAGKVLKLLVSEGDKIEAEGVPLMEMEVAEGASPVLKVGDLSVAEQKQEAPSDAALVKRAPDLESSANVTDASSPGSKVDSTTAQEPLSKLEQNLVPALVTDNTSGGPTDIYAGPYVRRLARELGIDLTQVFGSGPRQRIVKEDVQNFVKQRLTKPGDAGLKGVGGAGIPPVPDIDFSRFGPIETLAMSKIDKLVASNMHRNWLNVPHVTQFDDADITELEAFRESLKAEGEQRGLKITPVPFLLKVCATALSENPVINRSLHSDGEHIIQKNYYHIGMAVDTPRGLMVPVIRDVDKKGIWELAAEIKELADKARVGKLAVKDMQGASFTISSLGAIGGRGFTPIVNTPEVAIIGVSKALIQAVWNGSEFEPRQLLPLSLSYDHRVVNGGDAGRFLTRVVALLSDIRGLVM